MYELLTSHTHTCIDMHTPSHTCIKNILLLPLRFTDVEVHDKNGLLKINNFYNTSSGYACSACYVFSAAMHNSIGRCMRKHDVLWFRLWAALCLQAMYAHHIPSWKIKLKLFNLPHFSVAAEHSREALFILTGFK